MTMFKPGQISKLLASLEPGTWHRAGTLQQLWSGYGALERWQHDNGNTVIVKRVAPPEGELVVHPRGWQGAVGHQRKLDSYQVESHWYQDYASVHWQDLALAQPLLCQSKGHQHLLVMADLDAQGFSERSNALSAAQLNACIHWLARFHARFLGQSPAGLWQQGTYWHLATRRDEWQAMDEGPLKGAAECLDQRLRAARFQTLVHGDAKPANFCFSACGTRVAAVDFQYVGGGAGVRDLAYLLGACLDSDALTQDTPRWLDRYFHCLAQHLPHWPEADKAALEREWRQLYPLAVADFARFLAGWAPDHWKLNDYAWATTEQLLYDLGS